MIPSVSAAPTSPQQAVSFGAASSSSAVLQETTSTSLSATSQSSSVAVAQGGAAGSRDLGSGLGGDAAEILQALVVQLILQALLGKTDNANTEGLIELLGTLAGSSGQGAGGGGSAAAATSSSSSFSFSQTTSTTLAVSQESAAFFASEAYAQPQARGGGDFSALG